MLDFLHSLYPAQQTVFPNLYIYRVYQKHVPPSLLDLSGYMHARRLGHISFERWDPKLRFEYKQFTVRYLGAEI